MKRDHIFYNLFKQNPSLLFQLLEESPPGAKDYNFDSVEVKETGFRIDGVFLPPSNAKAKVVYFAEIQFQKEEELHHRFFTELMIYLHRNKGTYTDWRAVLIYGSRSLEPSDSNIHRCFLQSDQVRRIYLDELGDIHQQPVGLALMLLTIIPEPETVEAAKFLVEQAKTQEVETLTEKEIIDSVVTIMVYKFTTLNREEIETMLGINLEESRIYQEAEEVGRIKEGRSLLLKLLRRKLGVVPDTFLPKIQSLEIERLEDLGEALLDFSTIADLERWLQTQSLIP